MSYFSQKQAAKIYSIYIKNIKTYIKIKLDQHKL